MEWTNELRSSLEDLAADHLQRTERLRQMREDLGRVSASARTRDGMVSVEVGPRGELRGIHFDQRAFERISTQRMAHTIMELVGQATQDASGQTREITADYLPDGVADKVRALEEDFVGLLPDAPSALHRDDR